MQQPQAFRRSVGRAVMPIEYTSWEARGVIRSVPDPNWMRRIRTEARMTLAEVAEMVGCSYQNLQGIEAGQRPCPSSIAAAYSVLCERKDG